MEAEPAARRGASVAGVSADRMADRGEVRPDLMGAAGLKAQIEERGPRKALANLEMGDGGAAARRPRGHHVTTGAVPAQRGVDRARGGIGMARDQGDVATLDLASR